MTALCILVRRKLTSAIALALLSLLLPAMTALGQSPGTPDDKQPNSSSTTKLDPRADSTQGSSDSDIRLQRRTNDSLRGLSARSTEAGQLSDTALSADRIVEILRGHPELLPSVKRIVLN